MLAKNGNIDCSRHNVNSVECSMIVLLTHREIELILGWKEESFWPDEERVMRKLRRALENPEPVELSRFQIQVIQTWVKEQVEGHYGGGVVLNPEEQSIIQKLRTALEES